MASYTSYSQRRALGQRYGIDPALMLESERLKALYALQPSKEANKTSRELHAASIASNEKIAAENLAFNERNAEANRALTREQIDAEETSGMIGTIGNVATTGTLIRAMTKKPGEPFFGSLFGGGAAPSVAPASVAPATSGMFDVPMMSANESLASGAEGTTATSTAGSTAATVGMTAAEVAAIELAHKYTRQAVPKVAEALPGGEKEWGAAETIGTRTAEGAVIGSAILGVGTAIGATVGAIVGVVEVAKDESVICTELNRQGYLSDRIYEMDAEYANREVSPEEYSGYRVLADPIVEKMRKSRTFSWVVSLLGVPTATEMASRVDPSIRGTIIGKVMLFIFLPICRRIGQEVCHV